ncbi:hypothetical protein D3C81_1923530 [compost metagenome]
MIGATIGTIKYGISRPPVIATSPHPANQANNLGPKSRAGFMANPVSGPVDAPMTATRIPISNGARGPLGTPLPSSVSAIIIPIRMDVMTTSTSAACHTLSAEAG